MEMHMAVIITVEKTSAVEFDTEQPVLERRHQKTAPQTEPSPIQKNSWMQSNSVFTFDHTSSLAIKDVLKMFHLGFVTFLYYD